MTTHNRREIPHPVLKPGGTDHQPGIRFEAKVPSVQRTSEDGRVHIAVEFDLNEPTMLELIEQSKAAYVALTDCVTSRIRERHTTQEKRETVTIEAAKYAGEVKIQPFVVTLTPVEGFRSDHWSPWMKAVLPQGVDLPAGAILAVGDERTFTLGETAELQSCIQIVTSDAVLPGTWSISLEHDHIHIQVNLQDKAAIDRIRSNEDRQQTLWPSIYQSAVEQAIRRHTREEHTGKRWAGVIARKLEEHEIGTADSEVLADNSLAYAQQVMENPLTRITEERQNGEESDE